MKKRIQLALTVIFVVALVFVFTACTPSSNNEDETTTATTAAGETTAATTAAGQETGPTVPTSEPLHTGTGYRVWRSTQATFPTNLNQHNSSSATDGDAQSMINMVLLRTVPRQTGWAWMGDAAVGMPTISEDGLTWTFEIRRGLSWSDGTPINAHSFEYSARMLLDPLLTNRNVTPLIDTVSVLNAENYFKGDDAETPVTWDEVGVKAIDDYTLVFTLESRTLPINGIVNLGGQGIVHEALYEAGMNEDRSATTYGTGDITALPTAGPYYIAEYVVDQFIAYQIRPEHPMADLIVSQRQEFRLATDASTREQLFLNNEVDIFSISSATFDQMREDPRTHQGFGGQPWGIYINSTSESNPILQNRDLRHALFYATNRVSVAVGVFRTFMPAPFFIGTNSVVGDILNDNAISFRLTPAGMSVIPENDGYLPALANEYFDRAFAANNNEKIVMTLIYFDTSDDFLRTAEVLQESWMSVFGADRFELIIQVSPANAAYDGMRDGTVDAIIGSMTQSTTNPWSSMIVWTAHFGGKLDKMINEEFDELQRRTTVGDLLFAPDDERAAALARMEEILLDYMPYIPVFQNTNWVAYSERVTLSNPNRADGSFFVPARGFIVGNLTPMITDSMN